MTDRITKIYNFKCPRWEELPDKPLFNKEVVKFINELLADILDEDQTLTTTMVQNYIKLGFLPKPDGRKYNRIRIAYLIVITMFKQILTIKEISKGTKLQLKLMSKEDAYNTFCDSIEKAFYHTFKLFYESGDIKVEEFSPSQTAAGVELMAHAFALKLFGTIILEKNGLVNVK